MIEIRTSRTADTRTCDFKSVTKQQLLDSSVQHIADVRRGLAFFQHEIGEAATRHDEDKLTDIGGFHADFVTGFEQTGWWDRHRRLNRHHLGQDDGIPEDVNLIDVLDMIADCVMAGMGRSGDVRPLELMPGTLERALKNTVEFLKRQVVVLPPEAEMTDNQSYGTPASEQRNPKTGLTPIEQQKDDNQKLAAYLDKREGESP